MQSFTRSEIVNLAKEQPRIQEQKRITEETGTNIVGAVIDETLSQYGRLGSGDAQKQGDKAATVKNTLDTIGDDYYFIYGEESVSRGVGYAMQALRKAYNELRKQPQ